MLWAGEGILTAWFGINTWFSRGTFSKISLDTTTGGWYQFMWAVVLLICERALPSFISVGL